jgi:hypothetical protein
LFECQEFKFSHPNWRVESKSSFIWSDCGVELDSITGVNVVTTFFVSPGYSEKNNTFWNN